MTSSSRRQLYSTAAAPADWRPVSVREPDPPVEAAGSVNVEHPHGDGAVVAEAVLDAGRDEDEGAGRRRRLWSPKLKVSSPSRM